MEKRISKVGDEQTIIDFYCCCCCLVGNRSLSSPLIFTTKKLLFSIVHCWVLTLEFYYSKIRSYRESETIGVIYRDLAEVENGRFSFRFLLPNFYQLPDDHHFNSFNFPPVIATFHFSLFWQR